MESNRKKMRIISGLFKGKIIKFLKNSTTRPLKDIVKENIFNILCHSRTIKVDLINANVLDLYSGIGSFGIECLSRGAKKVTFIETDYGALNILKENINELSISNKVLMVNQKVENYLKNNIKEKFNIFFFDPPFADNKYIENLNLIKKNKIFKSNHVIIIHREVKARDSLDEYFKTIFIKNYGRSKIIFGKFN